jgi:hypothetical protein
MQLALVVGGESPQHPMALRRELQYDSAPIRCVVLSAKQAGLFTSLAELNHAVVPQAEPFGGVGDRGFGAVGRSGDLQQQLVLLGVQACLFGALLAKQQKLPERIAKRGERLQYLIVWYGRSSLHISNCIVIRCKFSSVATATFPLVARGKLKGTSVRFAASQYSV